MQPPIVSLTNPSGQCAAFSQTWLAFSINAKTPITELSILSGTGEGGWLQKQQATSGKSSKDSLPESGMEIATTDVFSEQPWSVPINKLFMKMPGFFYITIKEKLSKTVHAMAAIVTLKKVYFLEPETGLYTFTKTPDCKADLAKFYTSILKTPTVTEFKIYGIESKVSPQ